MKVTLSSLEVLIDDITDSVESILDGNLNGSEVTDTLSNMMQSIYKLVYNLSLIRVSNTPLLMHSEVIQIKKAYKEETVAVSDRNIVTKLSKMLILLKLIDEDSTKVIISTITYVN